MVISGRSDCAKKAFGGFKFEKIKYVKIYGFLRNRIDLKLPSIDSESKTSPYMLDRVKSTEILEFLVILLNGTQAISP